MLPKVSLLKLAKDYLIAILLKFMTFLGWIQEFTKIVKGLGMYLGAIFIGDFFNVPK